MFCVCRKMNKFRFLNFLNKNYRRYHDLLFYFLTLSVITLATVLAVQITKEKNEQELINLQERQIGVEEFTVKQKPIYVALQDAGLSNREVFDIVNKLNEVTDTRRLQNRDTYSISTDQEGRFNMLLLNQGFKHFYVANLNGTLVSGVSDVEIKTRVKTAAGEVEGSLFNSMLKEGATVPLIVDFTDAFSWTMDFNSETQNGDRYAALWEENFTADGTITSQDLLAAYYKGQNGLTYALYFNGEFYDETGKVSKKMFLKAPISFRSYRISSRFSYGRLHPILRIRRPHLGIDYAAPSGTPVDAVADGTVTYAGRKGGYGNYVEIKHANSYVTSYGHLKSFGKGIKKGARVTQGQTIGYVGSTGLSTGPHLDFRIKYKNKFIDFLKMKNRNNATRSVSKEERKDFEELKALYLKELDRATKEAEEKAKAQKAAQQNAAQAEENK